jgi:hypothetical protein
MALLQTGVGISSYRTAKKMKSDVDDSLAFELRNIAEVFMKRMGDVITSFTGGGVDITRGSPLDAMAENAYRQSLAEEITRYNYAQRKARLDAEAFADLTAGLSGGLQTALMGMASFNSITWPSAQPDPEVAVPGGAKLPTNLSWMSQKRSSQPKPLFFEKGAPRSSETFGVGIFAGDGSS